MIGWKENLLQHTLLLLVQVCVSRTQWPRPYTDGDVLKGEAPQLQHLNNYRQIKSIYVARSICIHTLYEVEPKRYDVAVMEIITLDLFCSI